MDFAVAVKEFVTDATIAIEAGDHEKVARFKELWERKARLFWQGTCKEDQMKPIPFAF